jgi:hypothetical protein
MAIYHTLQIVTPNFSNEPAYIFFDSLTLLYLLTTQLKKPIHLNNHPDKIILQSMVEILKLRNQPIIIKAHSNINGNEWTDKLTKDGTELFYSLSTHMYKKAHSTPYHIHKDTWPSMANTPYKSPIHHLQKYLIKHDHTHTLELNFQTLTNRLVTKILILKFPWTFGTTPSSSMLKKHASLKFWYNQYMGNAWKQLFYGPYLYPTISCSMSNSQEPNTWKHVLLSCKQQRIHALRIKCHNKAIWEKWKLLVQSNKSRCLILINTGAINNCPLENMVLLWLLPCTCIN